MKRLHALRTRKHDLHGSMPGKLPEELLVLVASHLHSADLQAMRMACKAWHLAVNRTISRFVAARVCLSRLHTGLAICECGVHMVSVVTYASNRA